MYALLDAQNAYASMEEIFRPALRKNPLCIAGSNDGCVISRNDHARRLGIKMSEPAFKLKAQQDMNRLMILSANFELYSCVSLRMHSLLSGLSPSVFPYSIDEAFCDLQGIPGDHAQRIWSMRDRVKQWIGLEMGAGIASTPTLAKLASVIAKQTYRRPGSYPSELAHVCNLGQCPPKLLEDCLAATPVTEIWGVGRRYGEQLLEAGVISALDLARFDLGTARKRWGVVMARTIQELNGVACVAIEGASTKQQITASRSLAEPIADSRELQRLGALLATNAAIKLRRQGSMCQAVSVFVMTSPYRKGPRYAQSKTIPLLHPTNDDRKLAEAVAQGMSRVYAPGYELVKAGIMLLDLCSVEQAGKQGLLDLEVAASSNAREQTLMLAVDQINERYGRKTVKIGNERTLPVSRSERMTPRYTTRLADVPVARA